MKKVHLFFLYAENCQTCDKAKEIINSAIQDSNISCEVKLFNYEQPVAINIAIKNNVSDLPACIVGSGIAVFQGENFPKEDIVKAIKKAAV